MTAAPLDGVRALDLSEGLAGPVCARLLADLGARVVKVERPGAGDPARALGPFPDDEPDPEASGAFLYVNAGKRGVTLDLDVPAGLTILRVLLRTHDVVIAGETEPALALRASGW